MLNIVLQEVENYLSIEFGSRVQIQSSNNIGGGCINHALKLVTNVGDLFLKWNANCAKDMFLREAEGLKELATAADENLVVPKIFAVKEADEIPGFLVQEYLMPDSGGSKWDEKLGRGLAAIHNYKQAQFGFYNNNYCGATSQNNSWGNNWSTFFVENRLHFLLELIREKRGLSPEENKLFDRLLSKIPNILSHKSIPVLIHGDLWSGNYMYTKQGPAIIDPATYYADREMEFAIIMMFGGFSQSFFDAYNEQNPLDYDWQERNLLYQLYHVLNHYYLFGGGYLQQALSIAKQYV